MTRSMSDIASRRRTSGPAALLCLLLATAALAGCASPVETTGSLPTDGYRTRYPIVVQEGAETLDIPVGFGSAGLSAATRESVRAFAADAAERGTSSLTILSPAGSGNAAAAAAVARQAREEALRGGVSPKFVEMRTYPVGDTSAAAPVRLTYSRIKATTPPCGTWSEQMMTEDGVDETPEFGCATQANFAAMIADPEDLIRPRAETPIPAGRRYVQMDNWLTGGATSSGESLTDNTTTGE